MRSWKDGVLKNVHTYEIMDPKDVGIDDNSIVLTARSGRAALKHRLHVNGVDLEEEKLDKVYEKFLVLADQKKEVNDADVLMLAGADTADAHAVKLDFLQVTHAVKLDFLQVTTGKGVKSVASIGLDISEIRGCRLRQRSCRCCHQGAEEDHHEADDAEGVYHPGHLEGFGRCG